MCEVSKQHRTPCLRKDLARKGLTKILRSKKGHNSVIIQFRIMGLGIQDHLMTLNKCVKFQRNSTHSVLRKGLAHKGLTKILKSKKGA